MFKISEDRQTVRTRQGELEQEQEQDLEFPFEVEAVELIVGELLFCFAAPIFAANKTHLNYTFNFEPSFAATKRRHL